MADPASYTRILRRRIYLWTARARNDAAAAELGRLRELNDKREGYRFAAGQGVAVPRPRTYPDVRAALAAETGDRFVLKPRRGMNSAAVLLLSRRAGGGFRCTMEGRDYDGPEDVAARFEARVARSNGKLSPEVIAETYVADRLGYDVPVDYKFYAFHEGASFLMMRYAPVRLKRPEWGFAFYDREGRDLGQVRDDNSGASPVPLPPPDDLGGLFDIAEGLVRAARVSFMRVDLFVAEDGPVFGEFTPMPNAGKRTYEPEWDARMGRLWRASLGRLGIDYF